MTFLSELVIIKNVLKKINCEVLFDGEHYFIGDFAANESDFSRQMLTDNKAHGDTLLLALVAICRAGMSNAVVVTGLPVTQHCVDQKRRMRLYLKLRQHQQSTDNYINGTINGSTKSLPSYSKSLGVVLFKYAHDDKCDLVIQQDADINYAKLDDFDEKISFKELLSVEAGKSLL